MINTVSDFGKFSKRANDFSITSGLGMSQGNSINGANNGGFDIAKQ